MFAVPRNAESTNRTDSGAVSAVPAQLIGFYVNSTNAGTLIVKNGGTDGTALTGTITPAIGWHSLPLNCRSDIFFTVGGTALNVTAVWVPR